MAQRRTNKARIAVKKAKAKEPKVFNLAEIRYIAENHGKVSREKLAEATNATLEEVEFVVQELSKPQPVPQHVDMTMKSFAKKGTAVMGTQTSSELSDESKKLQSSALRESYIHRIRP